jgi:hypothetical protein
MRAAIHKCLSELADQRPIFHSEADFQFAFAWKFREQNPQYLLRLEVPFKNTKSAHIDLLIIAKEKVAVEIKFHKCGLTTTFNSERFVFTGTAPRDVPRYGFLKDIERLETFVPDFCDSGFALMLTNDARLWGDPKIGSRIDQEFDLSERHILSGKMNWAGHASPGSRLGGDKGIQLKGTYTCNWQDFSQVDGRNGQFRYLLIEAPTR